MSLAHALIGGEQFGVMREALRRRGWQAWSCDLEPARDGSPFHIQDDVRRHLDRAPDGAPWLLAIFHPDCTYFTNSAAWAFADPDYLRYPGIGYHQKIDAATLVGAARRAARDRDAAFVRELQAANIPHKAYENPAGYMSTILGPPSQTVQPHWFGDDASKGTCWWLKNLPRLKPTVLSEEVAVTPRIVAGRPRYANQSDNGQNRLPPSPDRAMQRARTYPGMADACADQWTRYLIQIGKFRQIAMEAT